MEILAIANVVLISILLILLALAIIIGLICGLLFGIMCGIISLPFDGLKIMSFWILLPLIASSLSSMIALGLRKQDVETKKIPNQGIWNSAVYAGICGLIYSILGWLICLLMFWLVDRFIVEPGDGLLYGWQIKMQNVLLNALKDKLPETLFNILQKSSVLGLDINLSLKVPTLICCIFGAFLGSMKTGGEACIKHFILRLILYFNGYIPWNYARFLDYCTERLLLQRVGGRYRFIHKLLQDHFAQMPSK